MRSTARKSLAEMRRELARRLDRLHLCGIDRMVLAEGCQLISDGERRRLARTGRTLEIHSPLHRRFRRDRVLCGLARDVADAFLLTRQRPRKRQPRTNRLAGRHCVGLDGECLRDAHATGRDARLVAREHGIANLTVMRMRLFERPVIEWRLLRAPRAGLLTQTKEIRRRAIEVALAAVDDAMLEQAGGIPGREFLGPQIRDLRADALARLLLAQGEIQFDPVHAFGFELERALLFDRKLATGESTFDRRTRRFELAAIEMRDDVIEIAGRARHAEQQRRQQ
jgi:hypothetical protein